jgi:hypothetical protein
LKLVFVADILGFSNLVRRSSGLPKSQQVLERFRAVFVDAINALQKYRPYGTKNPRSWNIVTYTDNFLLETRLKRSGDDVLNALEAIAAFQFAVIRHGFLARGAATIGYNYVHEGVVYGQGLVEAHDLEANCAVLPRVILSNSVRRLIAHLADGHHVNLRGNDAVPLLLEDHDGQWFVNYLLETLAQDRRGQWNTSSTMLRYHHDLICQNLGNTTIEGRVRQKYIWASIYHNWFISNFPSRRNAAIGLTNAVVPFKPRLIPASSLRRMNESFMRRVYGNLDPLRDAVQVAARHRTAQ